MSVIIIVIAIIIALCWLLFFIIGPRIIMAIVKKKSKLLRYLDKTNQKYFPLFVNLESKYNMYYKCNSCAQFGNRNNLESIMNYAALTVDVDEAKWRQRDKYCKHNAKLFDDYLLEYQVAKNFYAGKGYKRAKKKLPFLSKKRYLYYEEEACNSYLLNPTIDLKIIVKLFYRSPAGRNYYEELWTVDLDEVFRRIERKRESECSIAYQRSLVTPSKRFDIFRRDNFRCQICGRTRKEEAVLEVDHIIPVSKGGKTIDSNLQTLCKDCNRGKRDKI